MATQNLFSGFLLGAPALPAWLLAGSLECQLLDTVVFLFEYSVELEKLILGGCAVIIFRDSVTVTLVCWW